jgi:gas vesicle protein
MSTLEKGNITLGGFLVGAAVGAVVGAGVALLFAPKSGKETREWIGAKSREVKARVGDAVVRTKEALRHEAAELAANLEAPKH